MRSTLEAPKYKWRLLSERERNELLEWRKSRGHPWHSPPHRAGSTSVYHLSASCYEHKPHIGASIQRMRDFCERLLTTLADSTSVLYAWCVVPNHYHALVRTPDVLKTIRALGELHGRTSYDWNAEDGTRGRKVWYRCVERNIRGERHRMATMNYVHNNAVHHGYVETWHEWPFGSAQEYLEKLGYAKAREIWKEYPILEFGKGWDDSSL
jgi:putative transposase